MHTPWRVAHIDADIIAAMSIHDLASRLDRAVAQTLGERFELFPKTKGHMDLVADEGRAGGTFTGHLFSMNERTDLGGRGREFNSSVSASGTILKVGINELPVGVTIRRDDVIVALDRGDQAFTVVNVSKKTGQYLIELGDQG